MIREGFSAFTFQLFFDFAHQFEMHHFIRAYVLFNLERELDIEFHYVLDSLRGRKTRNTLW